MFLRFNTHIILISFYSTPSPHQRPLRPRLCHRYFTYCCSTPNERMCERSAAFRVIRKKISTALRPTQMCGKFLQNHQNSKSQFFTSFRSTFRALCHFCVNKFEKFIFFGCLEARKKQNWAWVTNILEWKSFSSNISLLQIAQIKTSFSVFLMR